MTGPADDNSARSWNGAFPLAAGIVALVILVFGLGAWSVLARISGAVVTSGMIEVESNRQVVQHPDGGVVGTILVDEGDRVEKGDVLIRLDGRQLRSELAIVEGQLREISARKVRLMAERDKATQLVFPRELQALAAVEPEANRMLKGETTLFHARAEALNQEARLLGEQNKQIDKRIEGLNAQLSAQQAQSDLLSEEVTGQKKLLENQLTQVSRVNELLREEASLLGQIGRIEAEIAELRGKVAANEISLLQLETRRREEAVTTLRDLQFREIELTERQIDLSGTLSRLDIRAPASGVVYNLQVFTEQAVVRAAEPLLYVIPQNQALVVSARVETININDVFVGQEAVLQFPAFDQRQIPEIRGQVTHVSADVIQDETTGLNYYATEIMPYTAELTKLGEEKLLPGMPVEAFIETGERSPLAYLVEPMTGFFDRAFRE